MASEAVEQDIAPPERHDRPRVEPKEHPRVVARPEVIRDPPNEPSVEERFVEDMHDVCGAERSSVVGRSLRPRGAQRTGWPSRHALKAGGTNPEVRG